MADDYTAGREKWESPMFYGEDYDRRMNDLGQRQENTKRFIELREKYYEPGLGDVKNLDKIRTLSMVLFRALNPGLSDEEYDTYSNQLDETRDDLTILESYETLINMYKNKPPVPTLEAAHGGIASINRLTRPLGY